MRWILATMLVVTPACAGDFPTTRFYTPDGKSAGSATTYSGGVTKFYSADGKLMGTTYDNSSRKIKETR